MRLPALTLCTLASAAFALASCDSASDPAAPAESQAATGSAAGPEAKPGLVLSKGRLVLPAVAGNPAGAYFDLANGGGAPATVAAVSINGAARAEMHETRGGSMAPLGTLEIKQGETASFEPGGKHVMVFDLAPAVTAGGTAELTISFADGDKISAPLTVQKAGGMADHGAAH
jgi:periplasmic copper chaperone A